MPTATENSDPLYDDFNNVEFDNSYNPNLWSRSGQSSYEAKQQDGALVFTNSQVAAESGLDILLRRRQNRSLSRIQFLEARFKVSSDHQGGYAFVKIQIFFDVGGDGWWTQCRLGSWNNTTPVQFICDVGKNSNGSITFPYTSVAQSVQYDTWYVARIEIDSNTANMRFYLNNSEVGSYTPTNSDAIVKSKFTPSIGVWNDAANTSATRYVDYVRVTP